MYTFYTPLNRKYSNGDLIALYYNRHLKMTNKSGIAENHFFNVVFTLCEFNSFSLFI